jgi:hypothetical protein
VILIFGDIMNTNRPSLVVWRGAESFEEALPSHYGEISFSASPSPCPFCGALFERTVTGKGVYWKGDDLRLLCKECGFHVESFEDLRGIGTGVLGMGTHIQLSFAVQLGCVNIVAVVAGQREEHRDVESETEAPPW